MRMHEQEVYKIWTHMKYAQKYTFIFIVFARWLDETQHLYAT